MKYRPEVDGLRTVAVIPVILFHAGFDGLSGGFLGVDVFFVISGYLITMIILADMDAGKFSIIEFYERRARRILPALFFVMLLSIPFAWMWLLPSDFKDFSQSLISIPLFFSNILFWLESGYFDAAAEMKPLLHTWSLAVEEQFYVLFPVFLTLFWSLRKRWLFASILTLGLCSLIFSHALAQTDQGMSFNFYMLPTRAWQLMSGALVAFYFLYGKSNDELIKNNKMMSEILATIGLIMIFFSMLFFSKNMPLPSLYSVVPVFGVVLILLYSSKITFIGKLLSNGPMVGVGLMSYSLYLWHQPIFVLSKHRGLENQNIFDVIILILMTFIFAYLSWRFVEKPFRNRGLVSRRHIFTLFLFGSLFFISVGSLGHYHNGFENRTFWFSSLYSYQYDNRRLQQESWKLLREISGEQNYGVENNAFDKELWFDMGLESNRMLLVGNSHSKDIFNVLHYSKTAKRNYQLARYGVQISDLRNSTHDFYSSKNFLASKVVVLASQFTVSDIDVLSEVIENIQARGKSLFIVSRVFEFWYNKKNFKNLADYELYNLRQELNREISSTEVVTHINSSYFKDYINRYHEENTRLIVNKKLTELSKLYNITLLDRMKFTCEDALDQCFAIDDQLNKYFYDYGHYTIEGARFFGNRIDSSGWIENFTSEGKEASCTEEN